MQGLRLCTPCLGSTCLFNWALRIATQVITMHALFLTAPSPCLFALLTGVSGGEENPHAVAVIKTIVLPSFYLKSLSDLFVCSCESRGTPGHLVGRSLWSLPPCVSWGWTQVNRLREDPPSAHSASFIDICIILIVCMGVYAHECKFPQRCHISWSWGFRQL